MSLNIGELNALSDVTYLYAVMRVLRLKNKHGYGYWIGMERV